MTMKKIITIIFLFCSIFLAKEVHAYSIHDIATGDTGSGSSYDKYWNFTVSDINDRYLICQLFGSGTKIDYLEYNNERMQFFGSGSYYQLATFGLVNPTPGTNQFHVKYTSSWGFSQFVCMTISDIDQINPVGTVAKRDMCSISSVNNPIVPEESGSFLFSSLTTQTNARVQTAGTGQEFIYEFITARATYNDYLISSGNEQHNIMYELDTSSGCMDNTIIELKSGIPAFTITSPEQNETEIKESWITVEGNCPTNGENRIALTNDCSSFSNLNYDIDCVNNSFSSDFYYSGNSGTIVAVEVDSQATDCVDYDDLMDVVSINGIEVIEGYPDEWHFNYDYYDDFDIEIVSPSFDMPALTIPLGSTDVDMNFSFTYPQPLSPYLVFNMKQYDEDGNLLNDAYHTKALYEMTDTDNYTVNLNASSTPIHYVVQLTNDGDLVRQYPFGVFVSDLDLIINPDEYRYLFPRLVEKLKEKVVFNYYFAFYDGFYSLFDSDIGETPDDALDITLQSMSADGEYNLEIPIFKGSNETVKSFAQGLRPYLVGFLWLTFALYVVVRINGMFGDDK